MRNPFPDFGLNVYPSPTAKEPRQIGQTPLRRCRQCGLPFNTRKTSWSRQGDGLGPADSSDNYDRDVKSGHFFCGTLQPTKHKFRSLPDDRFFPSDDWLSPIAFSWMPTTP